TDSDTSTESLALSGDNWRQLATTSPPPRLATSGDLKNGARPQLAIRTQNRVFCGGLSPKPHQNII
ncbi:hypothetical protein A2U01_0117465, partial [Trifolium medium]|nr:hypothetical protein [Trifolium medium]